MATIPAPDKAQLDNVNLETGYPDGYLEALNKSYIANMNLDGEVKSRTQQQSDTLKFAIPRLALGAFTEVAAAMPGVSDEEAMEIAQGMTPDSVFKDFAEHKEGSQTAGALAVSFVPIVGMSKLMNAKKTYNVASKIFGARAANLLLPSRVTMMDRVSKFKDTAAIYAAKQQVAFTSEAATVVNQTMKKNIFTSAFDTLKVGLATDLGIYATLNESDFFFPEELSNMEMAAFYGVPNLVFAGASGLMMRYQLKNTLRDVGEIARKARNVEDLPLNEILSTPGNRHSYTVTINAQKKQKEIELMTTEATDSTAISNINNQIQQYGAELNHQVKLMAQDSPISRVTGKWDLDEKSWNTVRNAMDKDYTVMQEVISLDNYVKRTPEELFKTMMNKGRALDKQIKKSFVDLAAETKGTKAHDHVFSQLEKQLQEKVDLEAATYVKLNADGSMTLAENSKQGYDELLTGKVIQNSQQNKINATLKRAQEGDVVKTIDKATNENYYTVKFPHGESTILGTATSNMNLMLEHGRKFNELSYKGKTAVQSVFKQAIKDFDPVDYLNKPLKPTMQMHHTEADAMLQIADDMGWDNAQIQQVFKFGDEAVQTLDDLEYVSLSSKYDEFIQDVNKLGRQKLSTIKINEFDKLKTEDIIRTLNLPNDGITGWNPVAQTFMDLYNSRVAKFSDVFPSTAAFKSSLQKGFKPPSDILKGVESQADNIRLRGEAFKNYADERQPVYMLLKSKYESPLKREELMSQVMEDRMRLVDGLMKSDVEGAPLISQLTENAIRDTDRWTTARQVDSLIEGSQKGTDRFTTAMFNVDNQPAIVAVDAIREEMDNVWRSYVARKFEPYNNSFSKLLSHDNVGDLTSFNIFVNQQGLGWRGLPRLVPEEQGGKIIGYKVALEDHQINKSLFEKAYGGEIPEEFFMPEPLIKAGTPYKPLVISPAAAEAVTAFNEISQDVLKHINYLRKLSGRPPIPAKALHMPAKNLAGKEVAYLIDAHTGQLSTVKSANTPTQVNKLVEEEIALTAKQGKQLFKATENELENYHMVKLQAFTEMTDFSTPFSQTGAATGKSFGQTIDIGSDVVTRMQESLINQYATLSKVTSAMVFQPELKQAERTMLTAGLQKSTLDKGRTIWHTWMNRALGAKSGNRNQSIGKFYGAVEDVYDQILQKVWDAKISTFKSGMTQQQAQSHFSALDKAVPGFNPFKDSVEFLENTMKIKTPHNMIKHMSMINNITGLTMLRMFEVGLGLINIGTLPTLIPPVAKALARKPGQSLSEWKKLNAAWSSTISDDIAIWNPTRAFTSGMHFFWTDEFRKILPKAAEKGHLWQKTVEQLQIFTAPAEGYTTRMVKHGAEFVSKFVDKTEELSRSISYATFYNMGRRNLQLGEDAAMDFAHHMANRVIGDFRPNVRPQIFQGATGMPFSLFTTFAWNYLQRVFGYVEKGQRGAFLNQMGLQAAFFGAKSLPGFNQYVEHFTSNYDGSENMVDRLEDAFGTETADFLLHGSVGSLTGLAAYTRTDIPLPGSNFDRIKTPLDLAPAASLVKQTYSGFREAIDSIRANRGLNGAQLSEIASRSFPIRAVRGWFDIYNGYSVDARGQMINADTRNLLDITSKVSSIKTIRQQAVIEEFSRQRSTQLRQAEIKQRMRKALRSAFRSGNLDGDFLNNMAKDYLDAGGEPSGFKNFIKQQMFDGVIDKAYLRALELADKTSKQRDYLRLIEIISEDFEQ